MARGRVSIMELAQVLEQEVEQRAKARASEMLRQALAVIEGGQVIAGGRAARPIVVEQGRPFRPGYIKMTVEALRKAGKPLKVKEIRDAIQPEFPGVAKDKLRAALERSFFNEVRKKDKAIQTLGGGLYWIAGEAVPRGRVNKRSA
jgi:hypothetical protein